MDISIPSLYTGYKIFTKTKPFNSFKQIVMMNSIKCLFLIERNNCKGNIFLISITSCIRNKSCIATNVTTNNSGQYLKYLVARFEVLRKELQSIFYSHNKELILVSNFSKDQYHLFWVSQLIQLYDKKVVNCYVLQKSEKLGRPSIPGDLLLFDFETALIIHQNLEEEIDLYTQIQLCNILSKKNGVIFLIFLLFVHITRFFFRFFREKYVLFRRVMQVSYANIQFIHATIQLKYC